MSYRENIARIRAVYNALGSLAEEVVFVGGATVSLYADRETEEVRPTDDIDILVELYTRKEYAAIEEVLRLRGFQHDQQSGIVCRFTVQGITVDVMPIEESILGFSNRWYEEGFQEAVPFRLDEDYTVRIFSAPYFIASKIEAFKGRGRQDGRTSHDFEDIVYVLNHRSTIWDEMEAAPASVRGYLKHEVHALVVRPYLKEWIGANLEHHEQARARFIIDRLKDFVAPPK